MTDLYEQDPLMIEETIEDWVITKCEDWRDYYESNYEARFEKRDKLKSFLHKEGIGTLIQWGGKAVHQFKDLNFNTKLPKTDLFFKKCLLLPMNTFLSKKDINYVCDKIILFYTK